MREKKAVMYKGSSYSFEFYSHAPVFRFVDTAELSAFVRTQKDCAIYATQSDMDTLIRQGFAIRDTLQLTYFHITGLSGEFLNASTRNNVLERFAVGLCNAP